MRHERHHLTASLLSHARARRYESSGFRFQIRDPLKWRSDSPRLSERLGDVDGASPPAPIEDAPVADACYLIRPARSPNPAVACSRGVHWPRDGRRRCARPPRRRRRPRRDRRRRGAGAGVSCRRRRPAPATRPRRSRCCARRRVGATHRARVVPRLLARGTRRRPHRAQSSARLLRHPRCSSGASAYRRAADGRSCPTRRCPRQPSSRPLGVSARPTGPTRRRRRLRRLADVCREPLHCGGWAPPLRRVTRAGAGQAASPRLGRRARVVGRRDAPVPPKGTAMREGGAGKAGSGRAAPPLAGRPRETPAVLLKHGVSPASAAARTRRFATPPP